MKLRDALICDWPLVALFLMAALMLGVFVLSSMDSSRIKQKAFIVCVESGNNPAECAVAINYEVEP